MLVTHQRIAPRWKEWVPLATHQLRLRNLIQVLAFSIKHDKHPSVSLKENPSVDNISSKKDSYYYTLHSTTMSAPFYTSERLECDSPKWKEIDMSSWNGNVCSSANAIVLRLWLNHPDSLEDQVISVWGMYLNGLTYIGQHLNADTPALKPNSVVLLMTGGYFTDPDCLASEPKIRFTSISINQYDVRPSYTINLLLRLHSLQQAIRKQVTATEQMKQKISMGDYFRNETRGSTMLRRLLNKNKPKASQQDIIKVKENIEVARYRVQVLKEEKNIMYARVKELKERIENMSDNNQLIESRIMENYRLLMREVSAHREWWKGNAEKREEQLHSRAMLNFRTKQLISELHLIYPIVEKSSEKYTICGVHLPDSEEFAGQDEIQISVALGFVTHVIQMVSIFLQVPLRYPVIHFGSRSRIIDQITEKIPDSKREFPLFLRGRDKLEFHYAVYLLNKNIAQLRWLCGLPTQDLRNTLANLSSLVKMKHASCNLDPNSRSLSSSTVDICGSSLSISSPLGSVLSLTGKRGLRSHLASESSVLVPDKLHGPSAVQHQFGHRVSKSVGSAKDLMLNVLPINNASIDAIKAEGLVNSLSFSLDKGLNKYEGVDSESETKTPLNSVGSEPSLSASNDHSVTDVEKKLIESDAKNTFLKSWEAEKQIVPFSDDDSDLNNPFTQGGSTTLMEARLPLTTREESSIPELQEQSPAQTEILKNEVLKKEEKEADLSDAEVKSSQEAIAVDESDSKLCNVYSSLNVKDPVLESVKNRTEVLANQTTSFNTFRHKNPSNLIGKSK